MTSTQPRRHVLPHGREGSDFSVHAHDNASCANAKTQSSVSSATLDGDVDREFHRRLLTPTLQSREDVLGGDTMP